MASLERDPESPNGFRWSSGQSPDEDLQLSGTTAKVRATIESRPPITFVLPFLKSMSGG